MNALEKLLIKSILVIRVTPFLSRVAMHSGIDKLRAFKQKNKSATTVFSLALLLIVITSFAWSLGLLPTVSVTLIRPNPQEISLELTPEEIEKQNQDDMKEAIREKIDTLARQSNVELQYENNDKSKLLYTRYKRFLSENPATVELLLNAASLAAYENDLEQAQIYLDQAQRLSPTL